MSPPPRSRSSSSSQILPLEFETVALEVLEIVRSSPIPEISPYHYEVRVGVPLLLPLILTKLVEVKATISETKGVVVAVNRME